MEQIRVLARLSVMRACGFACLAILMAMMGMAYDPSISFRAGAGGLLILAAVLWIRGETYHQRGRIDDSEVWIMLPEAERPPKEAARPLIVTAMREELLEKAHWAAMAAIGFLAVSATLLLA
jgi:Ca2+/Na+ antiporter